MVAHGYLIYLIRAGVTRHPEQLYRMNNVGQANDDLLAVLGDQLSALGTGYHAYDKTAEGFRIKENVARGRTHWLKVNRGPAGSPGETYDLDTDQSQETTERQAQLSGLRAMFALPSDSYYGLLFVERVGRRHLKDLIYEIAIRPAGSNVGSVLRVEAFAELADWDRELQHMQVLRVSETLARRDSGEDASTVADTLVTISAEGGALHQASDRIKDLFRGRIQRRDARLRIVEEASRLGEVRRRATKDGVTFQDEATYQALLQELQDLNSAAGTAGNGLDGILDQVLPVDRGALDHKRFEFALGESRPQRNIVIERDTIPQFVYELGGRLSDGALRSLWVDHAEKILRARGVDLPPRWAW